jgi:protein CpxP
MIRKIVVAAISAVVSVAAFSAGAQTAVAPQVSAARPPNAKRLQLEQQLRQRTGEVVRRRLALNDDQMSKLQMTNRQFEGQRADLVRRERETRQALRAQLLSGDSANQTKVSQLLDQQLQLQRQRIDLMQSEQRELGKFLTPVQRAKYFSLQNEIRKRALALRNGQAPDAQLNAPRRQGRRGLKQ